MALLPRNLIKQIKAATDLSKLVREYGVDLRQRGDELVGLCPFHEEETPSFGVSIEKQMFHCFGCDAGGDAIQFVMAKDKSSFDAAARKLANGAGIATPNGAPETQRSNGSRRPVDWQALHDQLRPAMAPDRLTLLSRDTGVPATAWDSLSPGWATPQQLRDMSASGTGWSERFPDGAYAFVERSADGRATGLSLRTTDGRKGGPRGAKRGLILPTTLHDGADPVLVVEGASDVAACAALGLTAVGRPSNRGGAKELGALLEGREFLVVGERDEKPNGNSWPGRDGAQALAAGMATAFHKPVAWTMPPQGSKDIRSWLVALDANGRGIGPDELLAAGCELSEALQTAKRTETPDGEEMRPADALVELLHSGYRLIRSPDNEPFAVEKEGRNLAIPLRALRGKLARAYREETGRTPSASALADALIIAEGDAMDERVVAEPVYLRVGKNSENEIAVDLGDETGAAIVVSPGEWTEARCSPVLFRRTALSNPLPKPTGGNFAELRRFLHVSDDSWPLVVAWAVAALVPDIHHPILLLGGEQGTGKSTSAKLILQLVDPSPAPLRAEPRDPESWAMAASGSWAFCIDNISRIPAWFSDALCKTVTGDGWIRRKLYTDGELSVISYRRCVVLTSIDPGALRGDLADRLLMVDLERIDDADRLGERELEAAFTAAWPGLLGGLFDVLAATLKALPEVRLERTPRMADFSNIAAALDLACPHLTGGRALRLYEDQRGRLADEVIQGDPVAVALLDYMADRREWTGTLKGLLMALTPTDLGGRETKPRGWPASAKGLSAALKRLAPALRRGGIIHTPPGPTDKKRVHIIERRCEQPPESPEPPPLLPKS